MLEILLHEKTETYESDKKTLTKIFGRQNAEKIAAIWPSIAAIFKEQGKINLLPPGLGGKIEAILEFCKNSGELHIQDALNSAEQAFAFFSPRMKGLQQEEFYAVLLDSKHRIIRLSLVSIGSLNFTIVLPREVFAPALEARAASMILVHNHPSGDSMPSREDIQVTKRLVEVGKIVGIEILDHIVIGDGYYTSFLEQKLI